MPPINVINLFNTFIKNEMLTNANVNIRLIEICITGRMVILALYMDLTVITY